MSSLVPLSPECCTLMVGLETDCVASLLILRPLSTPFLWLDILKRKNSNQSYFLGRSTYAGQLLAHNSRPNNQPVWPLGWGKFYSEVRLRGLLEAKKLQKESKCWFCSLSFLISLRSLKGAKVAIFLFYLVTLY